MSAEHKSADQPRSESQVVSLKSRPQYESPRVSKLSEKDVLKSFQVTSAAATWWTT